MEKNTYPVSYDVFKKRILEFFIEKDWNYHTQFTKEEKLEFVESRNFDFMESYQKECENYDNGYLNVFTTPEDTHKYILGLLFDCDMYFISKTTESESEKVDKIDENKYPLTYVEFKKKMIELLIDNAGSISNVPPEDVPEDVEDFLKEDPNYIINVYRDCCEEYDKARKSDRDNYFSDEYLSSRYVWYWGMWLDYWFFL